MEAKTGGRERNEPGSVSPGEASGHHSPKVLLHVPDGSQVDASARPVCPNCGLAALPQLQFVIVQGRRWRSW